MDYCFYQIIDYRGFNQTRTVFNQASYLDQKAGDKEVEARVQGRLYLKGLEKLALYEIEDEEFNDSLSVLLNQPIYALVHGIREDLRDSVKKIINRPTELKFINRENGEKVDGKKVLIDWKSHAVIKKEEQLSLFYTPKAEFYLYLNTVVIFLIFYMMFVGFDLRKFISK